LRAVLLFLVGAFLVYHMMGKCGCKRVEGIDPVPGYAIFDCFGHNHNRGNGCPCEGDYECISGLCEDKFCVKPQI